MTALRGLGKVEEEDILESIALTLAHRARFFPNVQENNPKPENSQQNDLEDGQKNIAKEEEIPLELMIEDAKVNLPLGILE